MSSLPPADADKSNDDKHFARVIGTNLRRLRSQNNLSLEKLARAAGVSRAMLGQIELGQSVPTVTVLARIADAFTLPIAAFVNDRSESNITFLPAADAKLLRSADGTFVSRALFPFAGSRKVEFYELRLAPGCHETSDAHAAGTSENLVVAHGELEISVGAEVHRLAEGDAVYFSADAPHSYRNGGASEVIAYLVMTYPESISY
ncbi:MAG: helix-turn-helix transcriptional regulator [Steroidobacter sp.]|nr:XRE family transcriptional regulator [Steroidobacter sp.]MBL8269514.1 helix-turn-helix transcriptional regulator [Steroidobacter sp.]